MLSETLKLEDSCDYWREQLREGALSVLELPTDLPRPAQQTFRGASVGVALPVEVSARLSAVGVTHGCTLYQAVLGVWALVLCRHAGQEEVVIGSPYHGRDVAGSEGLIGYLVNVLALRLEVARGGTVEALLRHAHETATDGMRHAAVAFQRIVDELLPRRVHDASRNAVFQAMLGWEEDSGGGGGAEADGLGEAVRMESVSLGESGVAKCDMTLSVGLGASGAIEGDIEFNTDLFERSSVERLSARMGVLVSALV